MPLCNYTKKQLCDMLELYQQKLERLILTNDRFEKEIAKREGEYLQLSSEYDKMLEYNNKVIKDLRIENNDLIGNLSAY